jgi:hypothetical protein
VNCYTDLKEEIINTQSVFHLVTNQKFDMGQELSFDSNSKNTLFDFFLGNEVRNQSGQDIFQIVSENSKSGIMSFSSEESVILKKYLSLTSKSLRELVLELVRTQEFPHLPSRLSCLYAAKTYEDALKWKNIFDSYQRNVLQIVRLDVQGSVFEADNKRFETHSPIVMEFAVPPGGGQTPRQLRLTSSSGCYTDEKIIATINHYYQLKFRYLFIIFTENQQRKLINFIKYDNMTLIF